MSENSLLAVSNTMQCFGLLQHASSKTATLHSAQEEALVPLNFDSLLVSVPAFSRVLSVESGSLFAGRRFSRRVADLVDACVAAYRPPHAAFVL